MEGQGGFVAAGGGQSGDTGGGRGGFGEGDGKKELTRYYPGNGRRSRIEDERVMEKFSEGERVGREELRSYGVVLLVPEAEAAIYTAYTAYIHYYECSSYSNNYSGGLFYLIESSELDCSNIYSLIYTMYIYIY